MVIVLLVIAWGVYLGWLAAVSTQRRERHLVAMWGVMLVVGTLGELLTLLR